MLYKEIEKTFLDAENPAEATNLMRFFKTGPGEYGEGDKFLGIRVPFTRSIVKEHKNAASLEDVKILMASPWHEIRLAGGLLLVELFNQKRKKKDRGGMKECVDLYLSLIDRCNNWDLVDLTAPKILGEWLLICPEERGILYQLADMDGLLWHQRVAIVSTWTLIRDNHYDDALEISRKFLSHHHDLIHKASGWMLREVGKRGGIVRLRGFLDEYASVMPRVMLRYAIEKLSESERKRYLNR